MHVYMHTYNSHAFGLVAPYAAFLPACRYMSRNGQPMGLRPWRSFTEEPKENGLENSFSDSAITPDEPKSEPLPEIPSLLPAENGIQKSILHRQQSLVILTGKTHTLRHTLTPVISCYDLFVINVFLQSRSKIKTCQSPL